MENGKLNSSTDTKKDDLKSRLDFVGVDGLATALADARSA